MKWPIKYKGPSKKLDFEEECEAHKISLRLAKAIHKADIAFQAIENIIREFHHDRDFPLETLLRKNSATEEVFRDLACRVSIYLRKFNPPPVREEDESMEPG